MQECNCKEIWKKIPRAIRYEVSNKGRVRSMFFSNRMVNKIRENPLIIKPSKSSIHLKVNIYIDKKQTNILIHTLVLEAFIGNRPIGMQCCHNDGEPHNNRLSNLRWDTHYNNQQDKIKHGTRKTIISNPIFKMRSELKMTQESFGKMIKLGKHTISRLETGITKTKEKHFELLKKVVINV